MTPLYIDTRNGHTVVSHRTGPLYTSCPSIGPSSKTNRVQVVSKLTARGFCSLQVHVEV